MIENISPKLVSFSNFICIFAVSIVGFSCFLFATLRQVNSSIWQNPWQLFVAQAFKKFKLQ